VTGDNLRQLPGLMTRKISDALPGVGRKDLVLDSGVAAAVAPEAAALVRNFHVSVSDPAYGVRPVRFCHVSRHLRRGTLIEFC
jgi:hypothetical protein